MSAALSAGFADPVFDAQAVFRVVLSAFARPGVPRALPELIDPPGPLTPELAAIALALADTDAPLWLDRTLSSSAAVAGYLRFHTGARIVDDPAAAAFALVVDATELPAIDAFAWGSDEYPDRSTTIVLAVETIAAAGESTPALDTVTLQGPGIKGQVAFSVTPQPLALLDILRANKARFPRGLDCLLVAPGLVLGVPRSSTIVEAR